MNSLKPEYADKVCEVLELPSEIAQLSVISGDAKASPAGQASQRALSLPGGQSVAMTIKLK